MVLAQRLRNLKDDAIAGLVVAIVALPLAIGFAIASGVDPAMGVTTAIVAGFVAALLGGSNYQVSGPTGAMVVVVLGVVQAYGVNGLIVATLLAGAILVAMAALRLGKVIEYIPSPVIVGFTAGIAVIIFFGQLNNALGISPAYPADAGFLSRTIISFGHVADASLPAVLLALLTVALLVVTPRVSRRIPGSIVAVAVGVTLVMTVPFFAVRTVADVGVIPPGLPLPSLPALDLAVLPHLLRPALTIAALAAIESLLSAVVADGLTDSRHKPNRELFGQGCANIASALFGGMPATGAIARTATSVRNGAKTRAAAALHAVFLFVIVLAVAPLAGLIPLATLAGILMFVAFNMVEWERVELALRTPLSDVAVMATTFLLTVFVDLTVAIEVGLVLAALLFMKRMSDLYHIESADHAAARNGNPILLHPEVSIYTINGPLFFGAASRFDQRVATAPGGHKPFKIIRMRYVPVIDATGLNFLESTHRKHVKRGGAVFFSCVHPDVLRVMRDAGILEKIGEDRFFPSTRDALAAALARVKRPVTGDISAYLDPRFDTEEQGAFPQSSDHDPVEEAMESLGVTMVAKAGRKTLEGTVRTIAPVQRGIVKAGKKTLKGTVETIAPVHRKIVKTGKRITRRVLKR